MKSSKTLQVKFPVALTIPYAFIYLLIYLLILENVAKSDWIQDKYPLRRLGISHYQFEWKISNLDALVRAQGEIDCIFVGSSLVVRGIAPKVISESYKEETGKDISCFNFGVDSMKMPSAEYIIPFLYERYHPRVIVFGISPREFNREDDESFEPIVGSDWFQYQLGNFSWKGLAYSNSYAYQYLITWKSKNTDDNWQLIEDIGDKMGFLGFNPLDVEFDPNLINVGIKALRQFKVFNRTLKKFEKILDLDGNDVEIILLEMPVTSRYTNFLKGGQKRYNRFFNQIENLAFSRGIPFIRTNNPREIPNRYFIDTHHLNLKGAVLLSNLLAEELANILEVEK